ncbi:MerR family transcriptional regulator [Nicoliella lavandulae]|uniref:MerR family transcriptional regulator n=1 Tax=Nicoliella lavandulae TaxID=3082954 RepID=A0ABU8SLS8_9LACO
MNINQVSKKLGISKDTLRYWERVGLLKPIKRDVNGYRDYSKYDINWIFYIRALRNAGMSVDSLVKFIHLYDEHSDKEKRKQMLIEQRDALLKDLNERRKTVNYLSYKINHFDTTLLTYENEKLAYESKEDIR